MWLSRTWIIVHQHPPGRKNSQLADNLSYDILTWPIAWNLLKSCPDPNTPDSQVNSTHTNSSFNDDWRNITRQTSTQDSFEGTCLACNWVPLGSVLISCSPHGSLLPAHQDITGPDSPDEYLIGPHQCYFSSEFLFSFSFYIVFALTIFIIISFLFVMHQLF
jgi:hypothetical protein